MHPLKVHTVSYSSAKQFRERFGRDQKVAAQYITDVLVSDLKSISIDKCKSHLWAGVSVEQSRNTQTWESIAV